MADQTANRSYHTDAVDLILHTNDVGERKHSIDVRVSYDKGKCSNHSTYLIRFFYHAVIGYTGVGACGRNEADTAILRIYRRVIG